MNQWIYSQERGTLFLFLNPLEHGINNKHLLTRSHWVGRTHVSVASSLRTAAPLPAKAVVPIGMVSQSLFRAHVILTEGARSSDALKRIWYNHF